MTTVLPFKPADDAQHLAALALAQAGAVPAWDTSRAVVLRWAELVDLEPDPAVAVYFAVHLVLADLDRHSAPA